LAFAPGRTGRLFIEFALALAGAVVVSGFVALTLSPMMSSRLLRHEPSHGKLYRGIEVFLNSINRGYSKALAFNLRHRWIVLVAMVALLGACWLLVTTIKRELAPQEDRATVLAIISGPEGASIDYTARYARQIEDAALKIPEFDRIFVVAGNPTVTQGISFLRVTPWNERDKHVRDLARQLAPALNQIPGINAFPVIPPSLGQGFREQPVNFVIMSSDTYEGMNRVVQAMITEISQNPGFQAVDTNLRLNRPELKVQIDRDKAADASVQVETVGRTLETMLGGRQVTRFKKDGEQYDVIVQVRAQERNAPDDISNIFVRGRNDQMIPLTSLIRVDEAVAPRDLFHFSQRRAVTITANLAPDYTLGQALQFMDQIAAKHIKAGYATDLNGQSREFRDSGSSLALVFVLAILFIYLVLAAQFESFRDPFIILLTVPLGIASALAVLMLAGGSLNVYSQIGLVTLIGLITKNGILIVEFANQLQEQGRSVRDAVTEASVLRLRPILMTSMATVFGALPLALATGAGAESRQQIGWVIVGGMTFGTFLTLFVIPVVYSALASKVQAHPTPEPKAAE
jgi:multidrug efflux pump